MVKKYNLNPNRAELTAPDDLKCAGVSIWIPQPEFLHLAVKLGKDPIRHSKKINDKMAYYFYVNPQIQLWTYELGETLEHKPKVVVPAA